MRVVYTDYDPIRIKWWLSDDYEKWWWECPDIVYSHGDDHVGIIPSLLRESVVIVD